MPEWWVIALAIGAVARVTRFLVRDSLAAPLRDRVLRRYGDHSLAADFLRCDWCVAIWVAAPVIAAACLFGESAWFWGPALWLTAAFLAAAASLWADS